MLLFGGKNILETANMTVRYLDEHTYREDI